VTQTVTLHYHRPPDRNDTYVQEVLYADDHVTVTLLAAAGLEAPMLVGDTIALEPGAPIIWFTFAGLRHDIGRFHTAAGVFTGIYADIIEPVRRESIDRWHITDLFLDVWVATGGEPIILDREELDEACAHGWITAQSAAAAVDEAEQLVQRWYKGNWPPRVVNEWTLERVYGNS
jgi:uncharacterized protein